MVIADIPSSSNPTHYLILNKFPIIAEHFMLVTKQNKAQTEKLEKEDLDATFACLEAWNGQTKDGRRRRLFAFFNSGEHSGASQPHRHVQFLPVESMVEGLEAGKWELLMDRLTAEEGSIGISIPLQHWSRLLISNRSHSSS
jgi:sulfate adenylyltransferase (ADP) / ATP adenylyltransferase